MGKEEDEKAPLFPYWSEFLYPLVAMHRCIVKHDKGVLADAEGEIIKEADYLTGRHSFGGSESFVLIVTGYHYKDVEPRNPLGGNKHILPLQLPSVWDIPFRTRMALIGIVERDAPFFGLTFKFLQLLNRISVELRRGCSPWAFPYTLISCANADKKRLKVALLASLPVASSQAALALPTHCRSCSMARRTASCPRSP